MRTRWSYRNVLLAAALWPLMLMSPPSTASGGKVSEPKIKRQTVTSRSLASVGYDGLSRVLEIEFRTGEIYRYEAVAPEVYNGLVHAESKGRYFIDRIRGKFAFQHVRRRTR